MTGTRIPYNCLVDHTSIALAGRNKLKSQDGAPCLKRKVSLKAARWFSITESCAWSYAFGFTPDCKTADNWSSGLSDSTAGKSLFFTMLARKASHPQTKFPGRETPIIALRPGNA
ncbi:hypothetical protein L596_001658 [Steinernema carpocapsae]|uniref:Uncharacterized protein n=1 Tax=Steinernema carpocapsae TaxID=34508 RepID=A0A4U8UNW9_STECR|nr:hypothetical protein L596_001658 [Steinernema carpocapsae]